MHSPDLFFIQGAIPYINAHYGRGDGVNVLDRLHCTGSESTLLTCPHNGSDITSYYCDHFDDAGVECPGTKSQLKSNTILYVFLSFYVPVPLLP